MVPVSPIDMHSPSPSSPTAYRVIETKSPLLSDAVSNLAYTVDGLPSHRPIGSVRSRFATWAALILLHNAGTVGEGDGRVVRRPRDGDGRAVDGRDGAALGDANNSAKLISD